MLKRVQVLLEDWQVDFIRNSAKKFDFSFSETVRVLVSEAILSILFSLEPKKKIGIDANDLLKMKKIILNPDTTMKKRHEILSKIYFEARKATEHKIEHKS